VPAMAMVSSRGRVFVFDDASLLWIVAVVVDDWYLSNQAS
jgi:hypothetical protein